MEWLRRYTKGAKNIDLRRKNTTFYWCVRYREWLRVCYGTGLFAIAKRFLFEQKTNYLVLGERECWFLCGRWVKSVFLLATSSLAFFNCDVSHCFELSICQLFSCITNTYINMKLNNAKFIWSREHFYCFLLYPGIWYQKLIL